MKILFQILTVFILVTSCTNKEQTAEQIKFQQPLNTINTQPAVDSICTINEIITDRYNHFNELLNSLNKDSYNFSTTIKTFRHHITDTLTKFKKSNIIRLNLGNDYGLDLYINGLRKVKQIQFDKLTIDSIHLFQYYHQNPIIKDDIIEK